MNTDRIVTKVHAAGGYIEACDGKLILTAPKPLSDDLVAQIKAHKSELLFTLRQNEGSDHAEAIREFLEERAAIQEYDGGLTRQQAETEAWRNIRFYEYKLADNPDRWLVLIAPGCDLEQSRESLCRQFGDRLLDVRSSEGLGG